MKLINVETLLLEDFVGSIVPPYAILLHTWEADEVSFQDWGQPGTPSKKGYQKILMTCVLARRRSGIKYAWVDTCCIDKSSSSELTEAINSMFGWYRNSAVCFAYLSDLEPAAEVGDLRQCRWFTRGWTLQELIAPKHVVFFNRTWAMIGSKKKLAEEIAEITHVHKDVLRDSDNIGSFCTAARMSWAAGRRTTVVEDMAYCLLGIFDVNMPLLYGEGKKAFQRLQEEMIKLSQDMTIFAWRGKATVPRDDVGCLAQHPDEFEDGHTLVEALYRSTNAPEFNLTNKGLRFDTKLIEYCPRHVNCWNCSTSHYVMPLYCWDWGTNNGYYAIALRKYAPDLFVRSGSQLLGPLPVYNTPEWREMRRTEQRTIYIATKMTSRDFAEKEYRNKVDGYTLCRDPSISILRAYPEHHWDSTRGFMFPSVDAGSWGAALYKLSIHTGEQGSDIQSAEEDFVSFYVLFDFAGAHRNLAILGLDDTDIDWLPRRGVYQYPEWYQINRLIRSECAGPPSTEYVCSTSLYNRPVRVTAQRMGPRTEKQPQELKINWEFVNE